MTCLPFADAKPFAAIDLFCLNYAGGSTALYRDWNKMFADWISVRPVEFPGRGTRMRDPLERDPARLAERLCNELEPFVKRPFAIFGHSLGAAFGYRIARHFEARGEAPVAFFPSGRHSPTSRDPSPKRAHLDDKGLIEEVRALNGSPPEVLENRELMALLMPIIRADFVLSEALREEQDVAPLSCPVHVIGGSHDPEVPAESLAQWQAVAGGDFSATVLSGDHFFLHHTPGVEAISRKIAGVLEPLVPGTTNWRRRA